MYIDKFLNRIFSYSSSVDVNYVKIKDTYCLFYGPHGTFRSLTSAENECSQDSTCKGVYDEYCEGDYFWLCQVGYDYKDSTSGTCVYDKIGIMKPRKLWNLSLKFLGSKDEF